MMQYLINQYILKIPIFYVIRSASILKLFLEILKFKIILIYDVDFAIIIFLILNIFKMVRKTCYLSQFLFLDFILIIKKSLLFHYKYIQLIKSEFSIFSELFLITA